MELTREVWEGLAAPFPDDEIEFLPRAQSNGKALGLAYIDARTVMNRLDAVVGSGNWSFDFDVVSPDGKMVKGKLTVLGVTKYDAGEGSTEDEVLKSAVSDALKRCAVHFGIGRYLYYLPRVWAPYDSQKRRFTETPRHERGAVESALRTCGLGASAGSRPTLRVDSNPEQANGESAKKSVWSAGTNGAAPEREPESSGDRAAARPLSLPSPPGGGVSPPARKPSPPTTEAVPAPMVCSTDDCGKPLTKGQHDVSVRAFGQPLCPACQKTNVRAA